MFCSRTAIQYGGTALIYAATYGHDVCVRLLLDAGADKNVADHVRAFYIAAGTGLMIVLYFCCIDFISMFGSGDSLLFYLFIRLM